MKFDFYLFTTLNPKGLRCEYYENVNFSSEFSFKSFDNCDFKRYVYIFLKHFQILFQSVFYTPF